MLVDGVYYVAYLDDGHGLQTPGKRTPSIPELDDRVIKENEFNRNVVALMFRYFKGNNVTPVLVAPTDKDDSLSLRTSRANRHYDDLCKKYGRTKVKAVYLSVHYDAHTGSFSTSKGEGHSVFIYLGTQDGQSGKLADAVYKEMRQGTTQKGRGIREANFQVLRTTKMPAILTENGFMDNKREAKLMIDAAFQSEVAQEHVRGTLKYFGLRK